MPRQKRPSSPFELLDDDFDEDASSQSSRNGNPPMRNAANARERARMRVLSSAFGRLKTKLPNIPADTKLSKLDTLRLATMYIKQLKTVVECGTPSNATSLDDRLDGSSILNDNCFLNLNSATQNMTWPFGFHHQLHNTSNRSASTTASHNLSHATINWCHTEGNSSNIKQQQQRYNATENYDQQHQPSDGYSNHPTPPSSYETASLLPTPILLNGQNHEPTWYSETPSPDLCHSPPLEINYDNINNHHHRQQQQRNIMEHLSLIQLSSPPTSTVTTHSSVKQSFQQPQHQQHNPNHSHHAQQPHNSLTQHHHNHHNHHHQHMQHHQQQHPPAQHLHQGFGNATSFAAASIR